MNRTGEQRYAKGRTKPMERRRERGVIEPCLEDKRDREDDPAADRGGQIKVESWREEGDRGGGGSPTVILRIN